MAIKWYQKTEYKIALVGGFFVIIASLISISPNFFKTKIKNNPDSFSVTVLVHGKKGKNDRVLSNQGKVVMDFGTTREEEEINKEGEATFKEIPIKFLGEKALINLIHPQPYFLTDIDSMYTLEKNKAIYLEAELVGMDKIQGRVLDYKTESPIDSVRVSYQNAITLTDKYGWFELNIPVDKQAKFIRVNFYKKGYAMENLDSIIPHTKKEIGFYLKKK
jgi:hypothetical protein